MMHHVKSPSIVIPAQAGISWRFIKKIAAFTAMTAVFLFIHHNALAATTIPFTINMSEAVNVTGTPRIAVDVGGVTRYATYASGTGTSALTFNYDMVAGDVDLDGVALTSPIDLNGGTLKDLNGNDASLTFTVPNTSNIKVNYPSLGMDFTNGTSGRYTLNGTVYNSLSSFLTASGGTFTRNSIGTYFDSTGTLQTATANTPRFDYDPSTLTAKGLLIEESRTNYIRNSTMQGAVSGVIGSGGAIPTNWQTFSGVTGLTVTINGTGTENGMTYIDIRFSGTPTISQSPNFGFETAANITVSSGQTWTSSIYHKLISGTLTNTSNFYLEVIERNSSGTFLTSTTSPFTPSATRTRTTVTRTFNQATTAQSNTKMAFAVTSGQPIDLTLRLYAPQQELGAFATSYIPTTTAAVTRAADSLSIPTTGGWFNNTSSSVYAKSRMSQYNGYDTRIWRIDESSFANNLEFISGNYYLARNTVASTAFQTSTPTGMMVYNTPVKHASAHSAGNNSAYTNGTAHTLGSFATAGMPSGLTTLWIGDTRGGNRNINGWIENLKYYPLRISDAQLQLLTQ